jgi:hypothetical protein
MRGEVGYICLADLSDVLVWMHWFKARKRTAQKKCRMKITRCRSTLESPA